MKVLLIGSGGREHAFAWKISTSPLCDQLWIAPGNAGTAMCGKNIDLNPLDFPAVKEFVLEKDIDMVIVGPEEPLVKGIRDFFSEDADLKSIPLIGPGKEGARLEGSKDFSKAFMQKYGIPTASYQSFHKETLNEGKKFLESMSGPYVLKADGLAAGKGVLILEDLHEAKQQLEEMLNGKFGTAGNTVVIESFLKGIELSVFVLTDGDSYKVLPEAKDYKRIGDGDKGLNTGGMGAISPVPFAGTQFFKKVEERIIRPTILGLKREGIPYQGFLFIGLMNVGGDPYVIEYNVRMGDPETEVVLPRIKSDLLEMFNAVAEGDLDSFQLEISSQTAATVMVVSGGYPEAYEKGKKIEGLDKVKDGMVFHAGTVLSQGDVLSSGGRVLCCTGLGDTISDAVSRAYEGLRNIRFEGAYYRKDIGKDLMESIKIID